MDRIRRPRLSADYLEVRLLVARHRGDELQRRQPPALGQAQAALIDSMPADVRRAFRYSALLDLCASSGVSHLLVAHHLGDQQETLLHRFARSSGESDFR